MITHHELVRRALDAGLIDMCCDDYAEPGYRKEREDLPILFANWNPQGNTCFEGVEYIGDNMTMPRLESIFEHYGYTIEWSDEWTECEQCQRAFRMLGDSYSWSMYGYVGDHATICGDCIKLDPYDYLGSLENNPRKCATIDGLDPADHGYVKLNDDSYENGLYGGQMDDPRAIALALRAAGVTRFLFALDSVAQFGLDFSCYVHEEQIDAAQGVLNIANTKADRDPAEVLRDKLAGWRKE